MPRGKGKRFDEEDSISMPEPITREALLAGPPVLPPGARPSAPAAPLETRAAVAVLLSDSISASLISASSCLSPDECDAWIAWGEAQGFALERHAQTRMVAHRDNGRLSVDSPAIAALIFERVRPLVPARIGRREACRCNQNIRLYKYGPGQRFGPHVDGSQTLADGSRTEFTLLLYLNDEGLEGGATLFYATHNPRPDNVALRFSPQQGACLLHAHGDRCLTHEGEAVRSGTKYLLRTDVAYADPNHS